MAADGSGPLGEVLGPLLTGSAGLQIEVEDVVIQGFRRIGLRFHADHERAGHLNLGTFYITNKEARRLGEQLQRAVRLSVPED